MTQGKRQSLTPSDEDRRAGISGEGSSPKRPGCASSRSAAEQASWVQETRLDSSVRGREEGGRTSLARGAWQWTGLFLDGAPLPRARTHPLKGPFSRDEFLAWEISLTDQIPSLSAKLGHF